MKSDKNDKLAVEKEYCVWLQNIKTRVRQAQLKAAVRVNSSLLEFYWNLGADIVEKQKTTKWGSGFLKQLSRDLMLEFPDVKGFSRRNLELVRKWHLFYVGDNSIAKQVVSQLKKSVIPQLFQVPWGQNIVIIQKSNTIDEAIFYIKETIDNGWSRAVLVHQIENKCYERSGKAITNFAATLPQPQSDLANQLIKDPYSFDFLTLTQNYNERELEQGLVEHITKFLLELGAGFAYLGKQIQIQVGQRECRQT